MKDEIQRYDGGMPKSQNVLIKLTVDGVEIEGAVELPVGQIPRQVLLPVLQRLTDAVVDIAQQQAEATGEKVSCRKGCDACCRQMVPIAPSEAFGLAEYLDSLPAAVAVPILERFDLAVEALQDKGLLESLKHRERLSEAELHALDRAYFAAQVACPFLVDKACSIHAVRPLACREFLVSSPAEFCRQPEGDKVRQVAVGAKLSRALMEREGDWVPLVLARRYVAKNRPEHVKDAKAALSGMLKSL